MVYNRCVGTRFCSNNCPYKVRRFNFYAYAPNDDRPAEVVEPGSHGARPRRHGEMHLLHPAHPHRRRSTPMRENRPIRDGEVVTACQQSCPTQAIIFGDRNDPQSAVARRKASPLDYVLLEELNTRPRTSYTALIRNPNPRSRTTTHEPHRTAERGAGGPAGRHPALAQRGGQRAAYCARTRRAGGGSASAFRFCCFCAGRGDGVAVRQRHRRLGRQHPGRLGAGDRRICVVDRAGERRHDRLGAVLPDPLAVALGDQPHRRSHDAACRGRARA